MSLSILTYYQDNYKSMADLVLPNRTAYCKKYGFNHIDFCGNYKSLNWYYAIARLQMIKDYLFDNSDGTEFVWCLNVGAVIMNMTKNVMDYLDPSHDFFICRDIHGLNAGSFIVRRSDWSKIWLDFLIKEALVINHYWYENRVIHLYEQDPRFKDKIKDLPHPSINSYFYDLYGLPEATAGHYHKGDFVITLPGLDFQKRMEIINSPRVKDNIVY